ncbi:MAG: ComF family protein [Deltaproteobacteria bacterium CG_4_8_14_3_um_filter_45_9]|jgi:ComF family protein|nr:MAG: ComF family protein [Deltaproteobacteria bacterium CG03_land_8_20_14_0_80_45_14]PIX22203.1 MAG: ComF family protein [Deltaproteobacteria bacterium CG_4_8_14_3_um_filter_45_9]
MEFQSTLFQFFLPPQCPCCERLLEEDQQGFCSNCLSEIRWIEPPFCSICGIPFISKEVESHPCGACVTHRKYFTMARAWGAFEGSLQEAIHRWKYEGKTRLTPFFAEWMVKGLNRYWEPDSLDLLIPVPLYTQRLRERGFNQALLLVKELSRRTGIPYRKTILQKKKPTIPQVNLSGAEREKGLRGAFHIIRNEELLGKSVLLVDDVYTTGATVNECSKVLLRGGAERVDVLTLAHALKTS